MDDSREVLQLLLILWSSYSYWSRYDGLFGGTRLVLSPMLPRSSWRLTVTQVVSRQWDIRELELYADAECTEALHPVQHDGGHSLAARLDQGLVVGAY